MPSLGYEDLVMYAITQVADCGCSQCFGFATCGLHLLGFNPKSATRNNKKHLPSWELTYPIKKSLLKMIFLFPRWDMLVPWKVPQFDFFINESIRMHGFLRSSMWILPLLPCKRMVPADWTLKNW